MKNETNLSVQFSRSVVSDSLWHHGLQHVRLPCPSPVPGPCSNSCPLSRWCHPTILSSVAPLLLVPSILPSIRVFSNKSVIPVSQFFASGGQNIATSVSASVLPMNSQDWFPLGLTGLISLEEHKSLLQHHSSKASILQRSAFFMVQFSHPYMTTLKAVALTRWAFVDKVMSLLFIMLSRFVIAFLPRSKCLLIHGCSHHLQWFVIQH